MNDGQIKTRISLSIRILTHSFISPIKRLTVIHFKCACQIFRRTSRRFPTCHSHRKVRSLKTIILSVRTCPNNLLTSIILCSEQICKILIQSIPQSRLVTNDLIGSFCGSNPFTFIVIRIEQRTCSIQCGTSFQRQGDSLRHTSGLLLFSKVRITHRKQLRHFRTFGNYKI